MRLEEREKLMEFYERVSGARFHTSYIRPGGVLKIYLLVYWRISSYYWTILFPYDEMREMLTYNRIWKQRLVEVGVVTKQQALDWAFSGVMLRGSGFSWDLRLIEAMTLIIFLISLSL